MVQIVREGEGDAVTMSTKIQKTAERMESSLSPTVIIMSCGKEKSED